MVKVSSIAMVLALFGYSMYAQDTSATLTSSSLFVRSHIGWATTDYSKPFNSKSESSPLDRFSLSYGVGVGYQFPSGNSLYIATDYNHFTFNNDRVANQQLRWQSYTVNYDYSIVVTKKMEMVFGAGLGVGVLNVSEYTAAGASRELVPETTKAGLIGNFGISVNIPIDKNYTVFSESRRYIQSLNQPLYYSGHRFGLKYVF